MEKFGDKDFRVENMGMQSTDFLQNEGFGRCGIEVEGSEDKLTKASWACIEACGSDTCKPEPLKHTAGSKHEAALPSLITA